MKTLRSLPAPALTINHPFLNLDRTEHHAVETADGQGDAEAKEMVQELPGGQDIVHTDWTGNETRIEVEHVLFYRLGVNNANGLRQLLRQPWVLEMYSRFQQSLGSDLDSALQPKATEASQTSETSTAGQSHHAWKVERAVLVLTQSHLPSRYGDEAVDTTLWTRDDYDIHFIVRTVTLGKAPGSPWHEKSESTDRIRSLCTRALWLLLWFKQLHKSTGGEGREMQRLQRKREEWLAFLKDALDRLGAVQGMSKFLKGSDGDRVVQLADVYRLW